MIKKLILGSVIIISACDGVPDGKNSNPLHLPPQGFIGDSVTGETIYSQNCLACHGNAGLGTNQGPPLVHKTYSTRRHAELAFHLAVKKGVRAHHWNFGDMKPIPGLSPEDVGHVVQYVRAIQRKSGIE